MCSLGSKIKDYFPCKRREMLWVCVFVSALNRFISAPKNVDFRHL